MKPEFTERSGLHLPRSSPAHLKATSSVQSHLPQLPHRHVAASPCTCSELPSSINEPAILASAREVTSARTLSAPLQTSSPPQTIARAPLETLPAPAVSPTPSHSPSRSPQGDRHLHRVARPARRDTSARRGAVQRPLVAATPARPPAGDRRAVARDGGWCYPAAKDAHPRQRSRASCPTRAPRGATSGTPTLPLASAPPEGTPPCVRHDRARSK